MQNSNFSPNLVVRFSFVALVLSLLCATAWGQLSQGSIAGNVFDASGALVAGAKLTAKGTETGSTYATESSSAGAYRFGNLNIGTYDVTVSAPSFKTSRLTGVVVQVGTASGVS